MTRPTRCRRVSFLPDVTYFKPAGIPLKALREVCLSVDEAEAIRLKDLEGLEQGQCAEKMNISRPTFQRILASARQKLAEALLHGRAIKIGGGNFEMARRRLRCRNGHVWEMASGVRPENPSELCPTCNTVSVEMPGKTGRGQGGRHNRHPL
ncbi:DUF134 domain-containing protein [Chloroflexota bacterium]